METSLRSTAAGSQPCFRTYRLTRDRSARSSATADKAVSCRGMQSSFRGIALEHSMLSTGRSRSGSSCRHQRRQVTAAAAAAADAPPVVERLAGEDAEQWSAAVAEVEKVGYSEADANALLERAFGWRTQTFWRGLRKEEVPKAEAVAATLNFLKELGMKDPDIQAAFKKFPEGLASDVDGRLKPNLETMQKDHYIPEKGLLAAIKRQPKALGFSYDCEGSCEGECHRCWVRF